MLDERRVVYQEQTERLTYGVDLVGESPLDRAVEGALVSILRTGEWKGRRVSDIVVEFDDAKACAYNADALAYLGLRVTHQGAPASQASFGKRVDFGLNDKEMD
jgi:hypothetical protein